MPLSCHYGDRDGLGKSSMRKGKMNLADVLLLDLYQSLKNDQARLGERVDALVMILDASTLDDDLKSLLRYHWYTMRRAWHSEEITPREYTHDRDLGYEALFSLHPWYDDKYYYNYSRRPSKLRDDFPALFWQNAMTEDIIEDTLKAIKEICK